MADTIELRPLQPDDSGLIFEWRNDPVIVSLGTQNKTVSWEEHTAWISATIFSNTRKAYVILINGKPSGQIRFDKESEMTSSCVTSVYLLNNCTGKGAGVRAIKTGCEKINGDWPEVKKIYAYVLKQNINGQKAFLKAGFKKTAQNR